MPTLKSSWGEGKGLTPGIFSHEYKGFQKGTKNSIWNESTLASTPNMNIQGLTITGTVFSLEKKIKAIEKKTKEIEKFLQSYIGEEINIIEADNISFEEAKEKIALFFKNHHGKEIDYGDLMESLNLPLPLIVDACDELEKEGQIAGIN